MNRPPLYNYFTYIKGVEGVAIQINLDYYLGLLQYHPNASRINGSQKAKAVGPTALG